MAASSLGTMGEVCSQRMSQRGLLMPVATVCTFESVSDEPPNARCLRPARARADDVICAASAPNCVASSAALTV